MKCCRLISVTLVVIVCFFLAGFKKHNQYHPSKIKPIAPVEAGLSEPKQLDLTLPNNHSMLADKPEILSKTQSNTLDELAEDNKNKTQTIELKGNIIMSQEPEAGKIKSADGAGIMINLRP